MDLLQEEVQHVGVIVLAVHAAVWTLTAYYIFSKYGSVCMKLVHARMCK
jgi:hypothetical protein